MLIDDWITRESQRGRKHQNLEKLRISQRYQLFLQLQKVHLRPRQQPKGMMKDIDVRWNSTFDLLMRVLKLKRFVNNWITRKNQRGTTHQRRMKHGNLKKLRISHKEWEQVVYLIKLLEPFEYVTVILGTTRKPVIQRAWDFCNSLFTHLEDQKGKAEKCPSVDYSRDLQQAIQACREKLSSYYSKTDKRRGLIYSLAVVLDPRHKLGTYSSNEWESEWKDQKTSQSQDPSA